MLTVPLFGQIKLHTNGKTTFGLIPAVAPAPRVVIYGANDRALQLEVNHLSDWGQSSAVSVTRQNTVSWAVRYNNMDQFWVTGMGNIYARGAYYYSDSTLKQNVATIQSPLSSLKKLRGVTYQYRPEKPCQDCETPPTDDPAASRKQYGIIAQELERVFPEMVVENNEHLKLVAYEQLIPVLIEAVKEQQNQIQDLQKAVNLLEENRK